MRVVSAVRPVQSSDSLFGHCSILSMSLNVMILNTLASGYWNSLRIRGLPITRWLRLPGRKGCATIYGGGSSLHEELLQTLRGRYKKTAVPLEVSPRPATRVA